MATINTVKIIHCLGVIDPFLLLSSPLDSLTSPLESPPVEDEIEADEVDVSRCKEPGDDVEEDILLLETRKFKPNKLFD